MRVLVSAYTCDPDGGSEAANAWFTAEGLADAGAQVHILTRESDRATTQRGLARRVGHTRGSLGASYVPDAVPGPIGRGQFGVYARYAAWQARCHRWAKDPSHGPWTLGHHVSWGSLSHPVGLAGCGFPLVIGPVGGGQSLRPEHEQWFDGDLRHDHLRTAALTRLVPRNPVARLAAGRAALVLATNEESADLARRLGARKVVLGLAEGVRPGHLRTGPPPFPATPRIVWVGRFLPLKAAGLAVAALGHVLATVPEATLTFVGEGPTLPAVRELAADLVPRGRVEFLGHLPWEAAQQVLATARVHLFTSVRDSSSAQTLEAASLGVPTVALDAFGARTFLHRPGFRLVAPLPGRDLDVRFAEALVEVLSWSPSQWAAQCEGALALARENLFRDRARALLDAYRDTCGA